MGRTVPSFRIVLAEEKKERILFRDALDKSERKQLLEFRKSSSSYCTCGKKLKFKRTSEEYPLVCWECMIVNMDS